MELRWFCAVLAWTLALWVLPFHLVLSAAEETRDMGRELQSEGSKSFLGGLYRPSSQDQPRKYLLAYCLQGRLNNELRCMRNTLLAAQALNRTLLVPSYSAAYRWGSQASQLDYLFRWDVPVDWRRMQKCLAPEGDTLQVITLEDYLALEKQTQAVVEYFSCLKPEDVPERQCYGAPNPAHAFARLHDGVLVLPNRTEVESTPRLSSENPKPADLQRWYGDRTEKIICLGEIFDVNIVDAPEPGCQGQYLWMPHPAIVELVQGIQKNVIGHDYWAMHLRRGDFYEWLSKGGLRRGLRLRGEFAPMVDIALWLKQQLGSHNASKLFVATNARPVEVAVFKALVADSSPNKVRVFSLKNVLRNRAWLEQQPWAVEALRIQTQHGKCGIVAILADMLLCAGAERFFPSFGSTFSEAIVQIRQSINKSTEPHPQIQ